MSRIFIYGQHSVYIYVVSEVLSIDMDAIAITKSIEVISSYSVINYCNTTIVTFQNECLVQN